MTTAAAASDVAQVHTRRRMVCLIVLALFFATVPSGCMTGRFAFSRQSGDPMAGAPRIQNLRNPHPEEVVAHLNKNINRIQSWRADYVRIQTSGWSFTGKLAVEKQNHVRLVVTSPMGSEVDLGSNDERFWVWSRRMEPAFVTCKHENLDLARQKMGIPFEPQWLMQTLSMAPLPESGIKMESAPNQDQTRLIEEVVSAHGFPLRRVVLVDLKKGIVTEHSLYDYNGVRIALARLSGHRHDKATDVVLPHRVQLELPQNHMAMSMDLGNIQINPKTISAQIWEMPEMPRYEVVNLDEGVDRPQLATRHGDSIQFGEIESLSPDGSESTGAAHSRIDTTGRARLMDSGDPDASSDSSAAEWDR